MVSPSTSRHAEEVAIPALGGPLRGDLAVPVRARGVVLFAHGSGSGRKSPRNQHVAQVLRDSMMATLLMDLLTPEEERADEATGEIRFDVQLLAERLLLASHWLAEQPATHALRLGYFGASTGAAAALVAAAAEPAKVSAVVSRGGRPDLAGVALPRVTAPTLLIVGGNDGQVIRLNQLALQELHCPKEIRTVPGASHLFEEPGALEQVAAMAREWFLRFLPTPEAELKR